MKVIGIIFTSIIFASAICFLVVNFKNKIIRRKDNFLYRYAIRFNLLSGEVVDVKVTVDGEVNDIHQLIYVSNLIREKRKKYIIKEKNNERYVYKDELRSIELIKKGDNDDEENKRMD